MKLQLRCLPGSAQIEVTVLKLGSVMFDPVKRVWHRAGQCSLPPSVFFHRWSGERIEVLITLLLRHDAKRRARLHLAGSKGEVRVRENGSNLRILPAAFTKAYFRGAPPKGGWPKRFVVITAYNPEARVVTCAENSAADRSLRRQLGKDALSAFRVTGGSRDRRHVEPGWGFVLPMDDYAVCLCRKFLQLAYFEVTDGEVLLVNAFDESCQLVGRWSDLLIGAKPETKAAEYK
jgi:hypothetical protein